MGRIITLIFGVCSYARFLPDVSLCHLIPQQHPSCQSPSTPAPTGLAGLGDPYPHRPARCSSPCSKASWPALPSSGSSLRSCRRPPNAAPTSWRAVSLCILLFWQWHPLGGTVWEVEHPVGRAFLYGGFGSGWALVLAATFVINHFDLFGLRQTWRHFWRTTAKTVAIRDAEMIGFIARAWDRRALFDHPGGLRRADIARRPSPRAGPRRRRSGAVPPDGPHRRHHDHRSRGHPVRPRSSRVWRSRRWPAK